MMPGVHDAQPGDIFVDGNDKLWRVVGRWDEPCILAEAVEEPDRATAEVRQQGGISGLIWKGFKFLHRPRPAS